MKRALFAALALTVLGLNAQEEDNSADFDAKLADVASTYRDKIEQATDDLIATRTRIAEEKVPQLNALRAVEDRLLRLRAEMAQQRIVVGNFANDRARREQEADAQRLNISFLATAGADGLSTWRNTAGLLGLGEWSREIDQLRSRLDPAAADPDVSAAGDTAELILQRVRAALGGQVVSGRAAAAATRELSNGRFVLVGPETFFVSDDATLAGTVRTSDEGAAPVVYTLPDWEISTARSFADGNVAEVPTDVTAGKALQLRESQGNWVDHIKKGGFVGYVILSMGAFALLTAIIKLIDLRKLAVDSPIATLNLLEHVAAKGATAADAVLAPLQKTSNALFTTGLRYIDKPKEVIEEHLHAFILRERLHHERWLPMLAVIAAASPLLGLLGTVVGMVKTFTLITVFGTGNAGKLSSGISEALITTELGLSVAIPALVLHGFLSYRTQKNLSLLERYAVEFVTATEDHKTGNSTA